MGSSPLARGLRVPRGTGEHDGGIIPARAGFTDAPAIAPGLCMDHPRSRGVYFSFPPPFAQPNGSSPLARGLHAHCALAHTRCGIIPARAGFTCGGRTSHRGPQDHPRSRGVYTLTVLLLTHAVGSSPLARGLLEAVAHHIASLRIIPARAGFTIARGFICSSQSDHPRSRGVYLSLSRASQSPPGSSPLARGLPSPRLPTFTP